MIDETWLNLRSILHRLLVSGGEGHHSVTGPTGTPFNPTPYAQLPLTIMTIVDGSKGGDDVIQSYSLRGARRDIPGWQRGDCAWPNQLDDRNGWLNCRWRVCRHGSWHWRVREARLLVTVRVRGLPRRSESAARRQDVAGQVPCSALVDRPRVAALVADRRQLWASAARLRAGVGRAPRSAPVVRRLAGAGAAELPRRSASAARVQDAAAATPSSVPAARRPVEAGAAVRPPPRGSALRRQAEATAMR